MKVSKRTSPMEDAPAVLLFGGFEPSSGKLVLTVEAVSSDDAHQRMIEVAPLVKVIKADELELLPLSKPSRQVPLFMQGYFEATGWVSTRQPSVCLEAI